MVSDACLPAILAQLAERRFRNAQVIGSIPICGSNIAGTKQGASPAS